MSLSVAVAAAVTLILLTRVSVPEVAAALEGILLGL
jgi:hypothetical protein